MLATLYIPIKQSTHLRGEVRVACQVYLLSHAGLGRYQKPILGMAEVNHKTVLWNSLENVKDTFSTPEYQNLQKHILALGCPRSESPSHLLVVRNSLEGLLLLHSTCLSFYRSLKGQLRGCEASSNYSKPYPEPCPLTPMANLIWITPLRPNPTHGLPEHTSFRPQKTQ